MNVYGMLKLQYYEYVGLNKPLIKKLCFFLNVIRKCKIPHVAGSTFLLNSAGLNGMHVLGIPSLRLVVSLSQKAM